MDALPPSLPNAGPPQPVPAATAGLAILLAELTEALAKLPPNTPIAAQVITVINLLSPSQQPALPDPTAAKTPLGMLVQISTPDGSAQIRLPPQVQVAPGAKLDITVVQGGAQPQWRLLAIDDKPVGPSGALATPTATTATGTAPSPAPASPLATIAQPDSRPPASPGIPATIVTSNDPALPSGTTLLVRVVNLTPPPQLSLSSPVPAPAAEPAPQQTTAKEETATPAPSPASAPAPTTAAAAATATAILSSPAPTAAPQGVQAAPVPSAAPTPASVQAPAPSPVSTQAPPTTPNAPSPPVATPTASTPEPPPSPASAPASAPSAQQPPPASPTSTAPVAPQTTMAATIAAPSPEAAAAPIAAPAPVTTPPSAPAPAPVVQPPGPSPVVAAAPPPAPAPAPPTAISTPSPIPFPAAAPGPAPNPAANPAPVPIAAPPPQEVSGQVLPNTDGGRQLIRTPIGLLALESGPQSLPPQSNVTLQLVGKPVPPPLVQAPLPLPDDPPDRAVPHRLTQLLDSVQSSGNGTLAEAVRDKIPAPGPKLAAQILSVVASAQSQAPSLARFLGESMVSALTHAAPQALEALARHWESPAQAVQGPGEGDWRTLVVPFLMGGQMTTIRLTARRRGGRMSAAEREKGTRFLLDLDLSRLGPMQFDGLVKRQYKRFDLIIRTTSPLPGEMRRDIDALFLNGLMNFGLEGSVSFQPEGRFVTTQRLAGDSNGIVFA